MKKKQLLLAMLLASSVVACSSSSDGDDDAARRAAEQKAAEEAAKKAAEEAAKAAEEARKKKEQVQIAGVNKNDISKGTDAISDEEAAKLTGVASNPGYLRTSNNKSDFVVNGNKNATSDVSKPLGMTRTDLDRRLDTIIVAYPYNDKVDMLGYMEDFQFDTQNNTDGNLGEAEMNHIHLGSDTTDSDGRAPFYYEFTKTDRKGKGDGIALVYQKDRVKYFSRAKDSEAYAPSTGATVERNLGGTIAEVYGLRTYVENGYPDVDTDLTEAAVSNLPLVNEVVYKGANNAGGSFEPDLVAGKAGKLAHVQYGRVTTQLHQADMDKFRNGLLDGTKIAGYGKYGEAGTENVYFYRGLDNTTGKELAAVKDGGGKLAYHGHAVSYGLDDNYKADIGGSSRPNAIGSKDTYKLYSGNHVAATLDLETNKLSNGRVYNLWTKQGEKPATSADAREVKLVEFNGTLDNVGNITGTATRLTHSSANEGVLNATLYGSKAEELGGMVSSVDQTAANKWGAVFGAQAHKVAGDDKGTPSNPWAAAADENDPGKVN